MKRIEAVIAHDLIQDVERALLRSGIEGLTLTSVYSHRTPASGLSQCRRDLLFGTPCCKLDVLVSERELSTVLAALMPFVDPSPWMPICVMDLEVTLRIRTGECEEAALR
jgi:nitrogen regulatory protein PII